MNILALDLGTNTGWALKKGDSAPMFGTHACKSQGANEREGLRFLRFRRWLTEIKNSAGQIDEVYFEDVRFRQKSKAAADVYAGLRAILTMWCAHHDIYCRGVTVATIKKFATGKGAGKASNKEAMISAMQARGFAPEDDNQADALALLLYAEAQ